MIKEVNQVNKSASHFWETNELIVPKKGFLCALQVLCNFSSTKVISAALEEEEKS